jgi:hypothetical protein
LFEHNATDYTNHGIGDLMGCSECKARQTSEGEIELQFSYPCTDYLFPELQIGRQVLAKIDNDKPAQIFRIYGIEENIDAKVTVNCQHISYDLSGYPVKKFGDQISPDQVISKVTEKTGTDYNNLIMIGTDTVFPFTMSAYSIPQYDPTKTYERGEYVINGRPDKPDENDTWQCIEPVTTPEEFNADHWNLMEKFKMEAPKTVRELLLDGDDSILGLYGGDIVFNNRDVQIKKTAGEDRGVVIEYGVDLMEFSQDKNISEMVTGVLPYWKGNVRATPDPSTQLVTYEVYNGTDFEDGVVYYTREPNYVPTQDPTLDLSKMYYVIDSQTREKRPIEIQDLTFKEDVTYYRSNGFRYVATSDVSPLPGEVYYILKDGVYRESVPSDLQFRAGETYFEYNNSTGKYFQTQDSSYHWTKTYFTRTTIEDGGQEIVTYDEVTADNLTFKTDEDYYELIDGEHEPTQDEVYDSGKDYFTPNVEYQYPPMATSDFDFIEDKTYYESPSLNVFEPTDDEHYNPEKTYFIEVSDSVYYPVTEAYLDFNRDNTYCEIIDGEYVVVDHYETGHTYYRRVETTPEPVTYHAVTNADLDFIPTLRYFEIVNANYVETTDDHYRPSKTYFLERREQESVNISYVYVKVNSYDLNFNSKLQSFIYKKIVSDYSPATITAQDVPSTDYYLPSTRLGSFIPIDVPDLAFKSPPAFYYYEQSGYTYTPAPQPYDPTKVYYLPNKIEDKEIYVYAPIQYADGFEEKPASLQKIENLDLSEYFEAETEDKKPTVEKLIGRAKRWMLTNEIGIPAIDLTVQYAKLGQDVRLYDVITVRFPKLDIETKAKVTSYTYDVLKEQCTEIQVSNAKASSAWTSLEDASRLRKGILSPNRIGKKSITGDRIGTGEIDSSNISTGGVKSVNIEEDAVIESKLAKDSVTYQKIVDGTIITEKIKDGAVTGTKVLDQAISMKKLDKELQIFYSDIVSALQIFSDRATINRYVDSSGFIGDIYFIVVDGVQYSLDQHTHRLYVDNDGNVIIENRNGGDTPSADWTGRSYSAKVKAVFGA